MASTIKVNNIQNQCGANIVNKCSTTITLGASGDTIQLACGASQTGFGRTGTVNWDTTAKTASFTAVSGNGYFVNTTSGTVTMTLPASPSAGDIVAVADYANTFDTNNLTIAPNSSPINGTTDNYTANTTGISLTFVYVDGTRGWKNVNDGTTDASGVGPFIIATGGTVTCCGDYKIHTFTSPGTFTVTNAGTPAGSNTVDYLVVAGGGSSGPGNNGNGGGGAGGFRLSNSTCMPAPQTSPLATPTGLPVTAAAYPITVGAGGSGTGANNGSDSVFSTITSAGGGYGRSSHGTGGPGGSGGGARGAPSYPGPGFAGGTGNTPPVSPPQGNNGGAGFDGISCSTNSGGGGGAGSAAGGAGPGSGGAAGAGSYVISAGFAGCNGEAGPVCGARYFAGGGGGATDSPPASIKPGGVGGGGDGGNGGQSGVTNTGGGAGGGINASNGGSGIVIIRYKYQ